MNTGEDEPSSSLNGRLRPRRSNIPSPQTNKPPRKSDTKPAQDKPKRTSTPSKASPEKPDDLANKAETSITPHFLCPYCDKKLSSKQAASKHARRLHLSTSKQDSFLGCLFCNHGEADSNEIIRHMVDSHPNQYFACLQCHTRFPSTTELAEHKLNVCEKQKISYRSKLRQKPTPKKSSKALNVRDRDDFRSDDKDFTDGRGFDGIVISCELKPSQVHDEADIEDNITTNLILPPSKNLSSAAVIEKNAVILLDDIQWNKRIPSNFSFHNTDADQILSRLGVVHRSPRTAESTRRDWIKTIEDSTQKFERCFDTSFYSRVASNVQENLSKFLDGFFNFTPGPDHTIKTRKSKNNVVINTAEGFPILLAHEQYSRNIFDGYVPRAIAPKHKWKWDNLENDKNLLNPEQLKRDSHANNCIITLVSSLDIWTQLCMRRKFDDKFNKSPPEKKVEKQNIIGQQLKEILESREIPTTSSQIVKFSGNSTPARAGLEFPASLGLAPSAPKLEIEPAILSGEWVRPRCYVCCACGAQTRDARALTSHISTQHPNAQVQHYEIVGELLLNSDILKHLYVPPSQMSNRTRPMRGFRECTKCKKSIALEDLHQHMLDCAGDTPAVRRKCRYRPFGVRRRRPRMPDNRIRKKILKDIRGRQQTQTKQKNRMRPRPKIRTEVGDAETIRKMIADLPAKRHRVVVNPNIRSHRRLANQRSKLLKRISSDDTGTKKVAAAGGSLEKVEQNTDDDDSKPLKPKSNHTEVKMLSKESFKRRNALSRAQRAMQMRDIAYMNHSIAQAAAYRVDASRSFYTDQWSYGNVPSRINVNGGPYNIREHASRGGSNNREYQRPSGGDGENENAHHHRPPAQNVPLKHSIASLTANSETHDKAVQFHQLFLVQQECNNIGQHVPSGQRQYFENEAIVTKLDKPPLHFGNVTSFDTNQKSKLNKPRKGLNDCIAMLKNKLVEPVPGISSGHVSVQCGTDDPIEPNPTVMQQKMINVESDASYNDSTEVLPPVSSMPNLAQQHFPEKDKDALIPSPPKVPRPESPVKAKTVDAQYSNRHRPWKDLDRDIILPKQIQIERVTTKRGSARQRSNAPVDKAPVHDLVVVQVQPKPTSKKSTEANAAKIKKPRDPSRSRARSITNPPVTPVITEAQVEAPKSIQSSNQTSIQINIQTPPALPQKDTPEISREQSPPKKQLDMQYQTDYLNRTFVEEKLPEVYTTAVQTTTFKPNQLSPNITIDTKLAQNRSAVDIQPEVDLSRHCTVEGYPDNQYTNIPVAIPRAHTGINLESMESAPLDLSGKICPTDSRHTTYQDSSLLLMNYESYETLDLSKKNFDNMRMAEEVENDNTDEVVDLSIKASSHTSFQSGCSLECSQNNADNNDIEDLSVSREDDYVPTDLSLKKKHLSSMVPTENIIEPEDTVQDLSSHKTKLSGHEYISPDVDVSLPTDLSSKKNTKDNISTNNRIYDVPNSENNPIYHQPKTFSFSAKIDQYRDATYVPHSISSKQLSEDPRIRNTNLNEDNNNRSSNAVSNAAKPLEDDDTPAQKALYNSALHLPQYLTEEITTRPDIVMDVESCGANVLTTTANVCPSPSTPSHVTDPVAIRTYDFTVVRPLIIESLEAQERICYPFTKTPLTIAISTMAGSTLPAYSVLNRGLTVPVTKFESTTPVYTLANACITVTKIETSNSNSLTNTLLSIPSTTIANTTSVYTLAGTTIGPPINYSAIPPTPSAAPPLNNMDSSVTLLDRNSMALNNVVHNTPVSQRPNNDTDNLEQDPETAKKIAMLPKELVEILGTMPVDHRNQLLNVLPQYVSVPNANESQNLKHNVIPVSTKSPTSTTDAKMEVSENQHVSLLNSACSYSSSDLSPNNYSPTMTDSCLLTPPIITTNQHLNIATSDEVKFTPNALSPHKEDDNRREALAVQEDHIRTRRETKILDYNVTSDKIIDLTIDDNISQTIESIKQTAVPSEIIRNIVDSKTSRQKKNNDKTASLRAVRIKTPSERQKSMLIENKFVKDPTTINVCIPVRDTLTSDLIKTLAIQQAEISSTQQSKNASPSNKNIVGTSAITELNNLDSQNGREDLCPVDGSLIKKDVDSLIDFPPLLITRDDNFDKSKDKVSVNSSPVRDIRDESILIKEDNTSNDLDKTELVCMIPAQTSSLKKPIVLNCNENTNEDLKLSKSSLDVDEDDSEDDISLAVIVQQKREKLKITNKHDAPLEELTAVTSDKKLHNLQNNLSPTTNKRSKEKKFKKSQQNSKENMIDSVALADNTKSHKSVCNIQKSTQESNDNNCECDIKGKDSVARKGEILSSNETSTSIEVTKDKNTKKKNKKGRRIISSKASEQRNEKAQKNEIYELEINKENDAARESLKNTKASEEMPKVKIVEQQPTVYDDNEKNNDIEMTRQMHILAKNGELCTEIKSVGGNGNSGDIDMKKKDALAAKSKSKKENTVCPSKEADCLRDIKDVSEETNVQSEPDNTTASATKITSTIEQSHPVTVTEFEIACHKCASEKIKCTHKNNTPCSDIYFDEIINVSSNLPKSLEVDIQSVPLRRSRRGKSLFVDSTSLNEYDNVPVPAAVVEQKPPLTKKQRIFSKLLLDEENHKKPLVLSDQRKAYSENLEMKTVVASTPTASPNTSKDTVISNVETSGEKNKSLKRKKSPQTKRKHKKKKALGLFPHAGDNNNVSNVIHDTAVEEKNKSENCANDLEQDEILQSSETMETNCDDRNISMLESTNDTNCKRTCEEQHPDLETTVIEVQNDKPVDSSLNLTTSNEANNKTNLIEKRKMSYSAVSIDINQNSKPKKSKVCYNDVKEKSHDINDENKRKDMVDIQNTDTSESTTKRYKAPVASRRTRSKSVVVKSSNSEIYDPYDIDLEDMVEKTEPFIKRGNLEKKRASWANDKYINKNTSSNEFASTSGSDVSVKYYKSNKEKDSKSDDSGFVVNAVIDRKGSISDSDESSKSDVPLMKLVEEKEKRILELSQSNSVTNTKHETNNCNENDSAKIKPTSEDKNVNASCSEIDKISTTEETREQIRSEQFMESFGFFSERKPRKSNLLATKKISQTFHIIANASDEVYFGVKESNPTKKSILNESKKLSEEDKKEDKKVQVVKPIETKQDIVTKPAEIKKFVPIFCAVCKKDFRRPDNFQRHQMTLLHVSKLSEQEKKFKTKPIIEEPNYLIGFRQYLERLKLLQIKYARRKKKSKTTLPTLAAFLIEIHRSVRERILFRRALSIDEELFLDCCEMLKDSHKKGRFCHFRFFSFAASEALALAEKTLMEECPSDSDDIDDTEQDILDSEEVRNLENDLITGLKEAAEASASSRNYKQSVDPQFDKRRFISSTVTSHCCARSRNLEVAQSAVAPKTKKSIEYKEKMYPDVPEDIDMFEDKFDKIKRKCRSQAAAAKYNQTVVEPTTSHKSRKKSDKKKAKRKGSKKSHQNTVLTKGALKGFDGIKVSIPTSDINITSLTVPTDKCSKKKKKSGSKKKKDRKNSESSGKYDSDHRAKETTQKKVDVYEFMDNEDAELFEFRPSTLMERFKSINNKNMPVTSKVQPIVQEEVEVSSESASDGDDFVYMSDDYVCSDDETENSLMSCELGNAKPNNEKKAPFPLKRKDVVEKNAVMGKIFKHNAVRSDKKIPKNKEQPKPKANLDQLFDSLLENEPKSTIQESDEVSPKRETFTPPKKCENAKKDEVPHPRYDILAIKQYDNGSKCDYTPKKARPYTASSLDITTSSAMLRRHISGSKEHSFSPPKKYDVDPYTDYGPCTSKQYDEFKKFDGTSSKEPKSKKYEQHDTTLSKNRNTSVKVYDDDSQNYDDEINEDSSNSTSGSRDKSIQNKKDEVSTVSYDYGTESQDASVYDDAGVARQRARRKCTVGKQNILAETWSSESEPDGALPRSNSAESVASVTGRKKKGKKKEGQPGSVKRSNSRPATAKRQDECRVASSNRNVPDVGAGAEKAGEGESDEGGPSAAAPVVASGGGGGGCSGAKPRPRPAPSYWSDGEDEQEHRQQHGWIVGDSHKKLVTMLAHAKGRKRHSDEKRHMVE